MHAGSDGSLHFVGDDGFTRSQVGIFETFNVFTPGAAKENDLTWGSTVWITLNYQPILFHDLRDLPTKNYE